MWAKRPEVVPITVQNIESPSFQLLKMIQDCFSATGTKEVKQKQSKFKKCPAAVAAASEESLKIFIGLSHSALQ